MANCPSCGNTAIKPLGYVHSEILIIGDAPAKAEIKAGRPYVGPTGKLLRLEMKRVGINLYNCRTTNIWLHEPNGDENCLDAGRNVCLEEAKGKKAILLVGADTVNFFSGHRVMDVNGLEIDVNMFSTQSVFAMVQPAIVWQGRGVGELRFALENFAEKLREEEII